MKENPNNHVYTLLKLTVYSNKEMAIKCLFLTSRNSNGNLNGYNLFCKETAGIDGRFHMWIVMRMVMVSSEWLTNHTNHVCFSVIETTTHRRPIRHYATFNLNIFVERCVMDLKFFIPLANHTTVNVVNIQKHRKKT